MFSRRTKIVFFALLILFFRNPLARAEVKNGVYHAYYSNGNLRMRTKYKKGDLIYKKVYFKNGALSKYVVYKGRKRIKTKTYYENGQLQSAWTEKSAETKYYTKTGRLKAVVKDNPMEGLREKLPDSLL